MNKKRKVVIGVLGTALDRRGKRTNRWTKWRPSVGLCQQPDLDIHRFELIHQVNNYNMAHHVKEDIEQVSPQTEVILREVDIADPWDFEEVYTSLLDFS